MLPFPLFLALKYLKPKRSFLSVVTLISVAGVLLGVAILVIVLSVMTGFDEMWREKILSFKPHLTVYARGGPLREEMDACRRLEALDGFRGASPVVMARVLLRGSEGRMAAPLVLGLVEEGARRVTRVADATKSGEFRLEGEQAVMGIDMAAQLGLKVGDQVLVYSPLNVIRRDELYLPQELTVSGIYDMGMRDYDEGFILTSIEVARELVGMDEGAHMLYVMTDDPFRFDQYAERAREALGPDYVVRTWKDEDRLTFAALSHEKTMMFVLLVFITIVAIFCVTNTLIVITVQKTSEIGLFKALGFSSRQIMSAFIWHGWIQCLVGTACGIGSGLLVLHNLGRIVRWLRVFHVEAFPKEIYGLDALPWSTSPGEVARIALFVIVFCTLSSFLPAYRAARMDPVEALRHE